MSDKTLLQKIDRIQNIILCVIRKWWRPVTAIGIAGSMIVHGIIIPLQSGGTTDLMGLAALVTAAAGAFAVREWGKIRGNDSDGNIE